MTSRDRRPYAVRMDARMYAGAFGDGLHAPEFICDHVHTNPHAARQCASAWRANRLATAKYRCGARQDPNGCDTLTSDRAPCGAYRCEQHMQEHLALCSVKL